MPWAVWVTNLGKPTIQKWYVPNINPETGKEREYLQKDVIAEEDEELRLFELAEKYPLRNKE